MFSDVKEAQAFLSIAGRGCSQFPTLVCIIQNTLGTPCCRPVIVYASALLRVSCVLLQVVEKETAWHNG